MEEENKDLTPENKPENEDVKIIDATKQRYEAIIAEKDAKYSSLLRAYAEKQGDSAETPPAPTPEEERKHIESIAKAVRDNKISAPEQAKAILEYEDYITSHGGQSIFLCTDGSPSEEDIAAAEKTKNLLAYAVETSDGNPELFQAAITSKLVDKIKIRS